MSTIGDPQEKLSVWIDTASDLGDVDSDFFLGWKGGY